MRFYHRCIPSTRRVSERLATFSRLWPQSTDPIDALASGRAKLELAENRAAFARVIPRFKLATMRERNALRICSPACKSASLGRTSSLLPKGAALLSAGRTTSRCAVQ
jgi:hypothetical protein